MFNEIYTQELNKLVMDTKSLTIFISFKYLSTFFKIFEIFWEKTEGLRLSIAKKLKLQKKESKEKKRTIKQKQSKMHLNHTLTNMHNKQSKDDLNNSNNISKSQRNKDINISMTNHSNLNNTSKFMLSLFDLKVIYLLEYKKEYEPYFKFHPFVKVQRYFGYIFRLYSFSLKYELSSELDSFWSSMNLLTISFLDDDNFLDTNNERTE